jgi:hypothetical protein
LASQAIQWGANIINSLAQGIKNAAGAVGDAAANVAGKIHDLLGFHSPAKKGPGSTAHLWAPNLVNMFANDLKSNSPKAQQAAEGMIRQVATALKSYPKEIAQASLEGNKVLEKSLRQQKADMALQMKDYKDLLTIYGDKYSAKTQSIIFGGATGTLARGHAAASKGSVATGWAWLKDDMDKIISLLGGSGSGGASSGVSSGTTTNNKIASLTGGSIKWIAEPKDKVLPKHHTVVHHHHHYEIHTMARSPNEVKRLVDMIDQEQAKRVRHQTPGYSTGGIH